MNIIWSGIAGSPTHLYTYNIKSIPASFFLDPEGRIIAKNLRGPKLERKLSEIF